MRSGTTRPLFPSKAFCVSNIPTVFKFMSSFKVGKGVDDSLALLHFSYLIPDFLDELCPVFLSLPTVLIFPFWRQALL